MYKEGDIIEGLGMVEPNHCGLPWVAHRSGLACGVIQIRLFKGYERIKKCGCKEFISSILADALTGEELADEELKNRLNNCDFDYESKSRDCQNWRTKNQPYGPYGYGYSDFTKFKIRFWEKIYKLFRRSK